MVFEMARVSLGYRSCVLCDQWCYRQRRRRRFSQSIVAVAFPFKLHAGNLSFVWSRCRRRHRRRLRWIVSPCLPLSTFARDARPAALCCRVPQRPYCSDRQLFRCRNYTSSPFRSSVRWRTTYVPCGKRVQATVYLCCVL